MEKRNYQRELDALIDGLGGRIPTLLLHGCCAPCSSYVLEYLSQHFAITLYFYNPNISSREEYEKRAEEAKRLLDALDTKHPVTLVVTPHSSEDFTSAIAGLEEAPEGGERCKICYEIRLRRAAEEAKKGGYDYFTTTLSISPHKRADWLNEIGEKVGGEMGVRHLPSDFKKRGGYLRSVELSEELGLYRQDYCGCEYSRIAREKQKAEKNKD